MLDMDESNQTTELDLTLDLTCSRTLSHNWRTARIRCELSNDDPIGRCLSRLESCTDWIDQPNQNDSKARKVDDFQYRTHMTATLSAFVNSQSGSRPQTFWPDIGISLKTMGISRMLNLRPRTPKRNPQYHGIKFKKRTWHIRINPDIFLVSSDGNAKTDDLLPL
jgi:hypothetical protein